MLMHHPGQQDDPKVSDACVTPSRDIDGTPTTRKDDRGASSTMNDLRLSSVGIDNDWQYV